jgi:EAL domain-containing protein (putative c-di-GMP-specific phosphodiesterase class I)
MPDDAEPSHACTCQPRAEDKSTLLSLVREDRLETWFQPVFRADTLRVWGYECLARGRAIDGSRLSGGQLVDLARREDRLTFFDRVCRERHVANAGDKAGDDDLRFLINFSPTAVYDPRFCLRTTQRAAQRSGLRPDQLVFELIETEQIGDVDHLRRVVDGY